VPCPHLDAISPDDLRIDKLIKIFKNGNIAEVMVATDVDSNGEITAVYLVKIVKT
jgi:recombination protein RecR